MGIKQLAESLSKIGKTISDKADKIIKLLESIDKKLDKDIK